MPKEKSRKISALDVDCYEGMGSGRVVRDPNFVRIDHAITQEMLREAGLLQKRKTPASK